MAYDVFISYSRKDAKIVERIEEELNKHGISCFIDRSNIDLGADFAEVIAKSIFECEIILFIWSESSNQSENTANEIALAIDFEKSIVSFKIGAFKPDYKLAYRLIRFNRIDAVAFNESHIVELGIKVAKRLGKKGEVESKANNAVHQQTETVESELALAERTPSTNAVADDLDYESAYQLGKQALLNFDLISAFSDFLEPALHNYKDARAYMGQIMHYHTRIWHIPQERFDYVKEMADKGNSYAQYMMSRYYGVKENDNQKYYEYARLSADQNDSYGLLSLSRCYDLGLGVKKDSMKSMTLLKSSVAQKNPLAFMHMIKNMLYGWSVKKNPSRAIDLLKKAVEMEIPECISIMGDLYWEGEYVEKDDNKAEKYFEKAVASGYVEAYLNWANFYMFAPFTYEVKDARKGFQLLMKGAEYDEPGCLASIALCYYNGCAVNQDKKNALKWYKKAAASGNAYSFYMIGHMYYYGDGVETNELLAWEWFEKGAAMSDSRSLNMQGVMCLDGYAPGKEKKDCIPYFEESAFLGGFCAELSLLKLYDLFRTKDLENYDIFKVDDSTFLDYPWAEKDARKAVDYLKRAAEMGNADALLKCGVLLTDIERSYSDEIVGYGYLKQALEKKNYKAALQLGYLYENGIGVPMDEEKAKEFFKLAVENNVGRIADYEYGRMLKAESSDEPDNAEKREQALAYLRRAADAGYEKAYEPLYSMLTDDLDFDELENNPKAVEILNWIKKASEANQVQAILDMGICCQVGIGRTKDVGEAIEWYRKATLMYNETAPFNIGDIYDNGEGDVAKDLAKAIYWYDKADQYGNEEAKEKLEEAKQRRQAFVEAFEQSPDMKDLDEYIRLVFKGENVEISQSVLDEFYAPCREAVAGLSMQDVMREEFVECKYLPKYVNDLYTAWNDVRILADRMELGALSAYENEAFFPFCSPAMITIMRKEIVELWLRLKNAYKEKLKNVTLIAHEAIVDIAEGMNDDELQLILVSIVEIMIDLDWVDLANEEVAGLIAANKQQNLHYADIFYTGTDYTVRSYAIAKKLYELENDEEIARERLELMNEKLILDSDSIEEVTTTKEESDDDEFEQLLDEFMNSELDKE